jgi:hypothetical protein
VTPVLSSAAPHDAQDLLPVVRAAALSEPEPGRAWLISMLWARSGVGILGGAPKCCKSWLGLDLALSVASGSPALGCFAVSESGPAMIYLAEDALSVTKERLTGICRYRRLRLEDLPIDVITAPSLRLDLDRDRQRLARTVERHRPRLLLLDPFVRLHRIDENHAGDVSALLGFLRELQRAFDIAVLVVHHARKNAAAGVAPGQGLRGSGDLHAWGDSNLYVRRQRGDLILSVEHRAAAAPAAISLTLVAEPADQVHLEVQSGKSQDRVHSSTTSLDDDVLDTLAKFGPLRRDDLRTALRVRNERLGLALGRLVAQGRIGRCDDRWLIPSRDPLRDERERNRNGSATQQRPSA